MKNVFLVLLASVVTFPAMAFEKASRSYYDGVQAIICPGAYGEEKTYCAGGVLASAMLTFSPTTIVLSPFILTAELTNSNLKVILAAKEDATYFVASEGEARTVRFEAARNAFFEHNPQLQASDMDLAKWILAL
jgi:conserverd hypothetical protein